MLLIKTKQSFAALRLWKPFNSVPVGAAEGCDLLTLIFKGKDQKIAACGSSYIGMRIP
jgi:hypothetical protein